MASKYVIYTLLGLAKPKAISLTALCNIKPEQWLFPLTSNNIPDLSKEAQGQMSIRHPIPQWTSAIKCKATDPYRLQSSLYEPQDLNWSQGRVLHLSHELSQARRSLSDLQTTTCCSGELLFQLLLPGMCSHHCQDLGQAIQSQRQMGLTEERASNDLSPIYIKEITSQIALEEQAL